MTADGAMTTDSGTSGDSGIPVLIARTPYREFYQRFMIPNKPCLLQQEVTECWPSRRQWITGSGAIDFDHLLSRYSGDEVPISDCTSRYFNSQKSQEMLFSEFVSYWKNLISSGYDFSRNPCLYLKDWHFFIEHPQPPVYSVPIFFESDWLNQHWLKDAAVHEPINDYRFVYMGPKGSSTPLHKDVYSSFSWSANLCGEKEWILIPPERESLLRSKYSQPGRELPYDIRGLLTDAQFVQDISPIVVRQSAGQVMFVPSDWIHQVRNTEDTISINHNWFNACNISFVWKGLMKALTDVRSQISDIRSTSSNWTIDCQNLLRIHHGLNFQDLVEILQTKIRSLGREVDSLTRSQGKTVPSNSDKTIPPSSLPVFLSQSDLLFRLNHEIDSLTEFLPSLQQELDKETSFAKFSDAVSVMSSQLVTISSEQLFQCQREGLCSVSACK